MSHRLGLNSIKKTGESEITGDVELTAGTNVTLTQSGNTITIASSGEVAGSVATHAALTATHGATGAVVGTTNSQTLQNKTLDNPTIATIYTGTGNITIPAGPDTLVGRATTDTLTNKRINPRAPGAASAGTITPTSDASDLYRVTALATNATIAAPTGTPVDGQKLMLRLKDNGTSRTLSWNAAYRAIGVTLPTATTIAKTQYIGCIYNDADSTWDVLAVGLET